MKTRPILFSAPMVRALLDGQKSQTRRVVKFGKAYEKKPPTIQEAVDRYGAPGHFTLEAGFFEARCPYGAPGDRLWVRETSIIAPKHWSDDAKILQHVVDREGDLRVIQYLATAPDREAPNDYGLKATPSIFMPRWASRITLEVTGVRVERLNDISEEDAKAEGVVKGLGGNWVDYESKQHPSGEYKGCVYSARGSFQTLWSSINGADSLALNPWVWCISFRNMPKPGDKP